MCPSVLSTYTRCNFSQWIQMGKGFKNSFTQLKHTTKQPNRFNLVFRDNIAWTYPIHIGWFCRGRVWVVTAASGAPVLHPSPSHSARVCLGAWCAISIIYALSAEWVNVPPQRSGRVTWRPSTDRKTRRLVRFYMKTPEFAFDSLVAGLGWRREPAAAASLTLAGSFSKWSGRDEQAIDASGDLLFSNSP